MRATAPFSKALALTSGGVLFGLALSSSAFSAERRYYPSIDGPKPVDESLPRGEGQRFLLKGAEYVGEAERLYEHARHQRDKYVVIADAVDEERIRRILLKDQMRQGVRFDRKNDTLTRWFIEDSWARQAKEEWIAKRPEYIIDRDIGEFKIDGGTADIEEREVPVLYRFRHVSARMKGSDRRKFYVMVRFPESGEKYFRHDELWIQRPVRLVRHGSNYTLEARGKYEGHNIRWPSTNGCRVYIGTVGTYPGPVIEAYLKKYPSTLPSDFQYDRNEWGREHVDITIEKLKASLSLPHHGPGKFIVHLRWLARWIDTDFYKRLSANATRDEMAAMLAEVEAWARENRDRLTWDPKRQR
ncbi:MAG: hypothetical protein ACYS9X_32190, partial [Planctomycetota bacterium]